MFGNRWQTPDERIDERIETVVSEANDKKALFWICFQTHLRLKMYMYMEVIYMDALFWVFSDEIHMMAVFLC